ncbi:DUF4093 domain-containing protein [Ruminococcus sp. FC2018]|uniref:toprim domain-containing protein n=1 Tax=Ruminococcus sp. FC2018 TaxID=1410617 RepID=UPI00056512A7|nr:DUF4093 domain-containing protein [Ruminococcus sp. FC2018]
MDKLKIRQTIIVEGKYDKIKLSAIVDAVIICTNGFGIFNDKNKSELIRHYASNTGIIILTDSDYAGMMIRNHIKGIVSSGKIINLYIPEIFGKEKRKSTASKEGKLGVEGIDVTVLRDVFEKSGVLAQDKDGEDKVTANDFYQLGLSGKPFSSNMRKQLCKKLSIPVGLSTKALMDYINSSVDHSAFYNAISQILNDTP